MTRKRSKEHSVSIEEYLDTESHSLVRHEYVDGKLFGMVGSSAAHNLIALNLYVLLRSHARGSGCAVFVSDMKVKIETTNSFYYPDVLVTCDRPEPTARFVSNPLLIIEVLSPSETEIDVNEKVPLYRHIDSLKEYVIIHQDKKVAEVYTRQGSNWSGQIVNSGEDLVLSCLPSGAFSARLDAIYDEVGVD